MRYGVARDLITPAFAMNMGGYGTRYDNPIGDVHDDLYVKALMLDDGRQKLLLLTYDALFHEHSWNDRVADYAQAKHAIPGDSVVVSWTHNHCGPATADYMPGQESAAYEQFLWERTLSCIDRAMMNTHEGRISYGTVEGDWNVSRRKCVDGHMVMAPNSEADKDRTIAMLRCDDDAGNLRALMLNWSCHPVTMSDVLAYSGEYPGRLCQLLDAALYGAQTLFVQSAGADTRPRITSDGDAFRKCDFHEVDEMARSMAEAVLRALRSDCFEPLDLKLAGAQFTVPLETETYPRSYFEAYASNSQLQCHSIWAQLILEQYDAMEPLLPLHCGLIRLTDDLLLAHMGGEVTYELKQVVQAALAPKRVIFVGYTDDCAYVPGDRIIQEGGYEAEGSVVEYMLKGAIQPGVNAKLTAAFQEVASKV